MDINKLKNAGNDTANQNTETSVSDNIKQTIENATAADNNSVSAEKEMITTNAFDKVEEKSEEKIFDETYKEIKEKNISAECTGLNVTTIPDAINLNAGVAKKYVYGIPKQDNEIVTSTTIVTKTIASDVSVDDSFELPIFKAKQVVKVEGVNLDAYFKQYNSNVLPVSVVGLDTNAEEIEGYDTLVFQDTVFVLANSIINNEDMSDVYASIVNELSKGKLYQASILKVVGTEYGEVISMKLNYLAIKKIEKALPDYKVRLHAVKENNAKVIDYILTISREL